MGAGAVRVIVGAVDRTQVRVVAEPIDGEVSSLRPEAAALLLLLRTLPRTAKVVVFTDSLSLMTTLMAYSTLQGRRRGRASPHALLMAQIADTLATWEGHI
eukprot:3686324-Rhodomonas_salina.1